MPEFAEFRPAISSEPWDVRTRRAGRSDVAALTRLHAAREHVDRDAAERTVEAWLDGEEQIVLVAEHLGGVVGYGTTTHLDPVARGGEAPSGWYLTGLVVAPGSRRHGVGRELTRARLGEICAFAREAWYFANERNAASVALHAQLGFVEHTRVFNIPGVEFSGGAGVLFRVDLR